MIDFLNGVSQDVGHPSLDGGHGSNEEVYFTPESPRRLRSRSEILRLISSYRCPDPQSPNWYIIYL